VLLFALAAGVAAAGHAEADESDATAGIQLFGMTYVASAESRNVLVLDARQARVAPASRVATLLGVHARLSSRDGRGGMQLRCDRGTFTLGRGDFVAEGNVRGTTVDGRRFRTERLRYQNDTGIVSTELPVQIEDETGTYRGGGFIYYLREDRFRMVGGAELVHES